MDGIIQEVFKEYYEVTTAKRNAMLSLKFPEVTEVLKEIQQELIEKIKQESGYFKDGNIIHLKHKIITLEKLIGDNQE